MSKLSIAVTIDKDFVLDAIAEKINREEIVLKVTPEQVVIADDGRFLASVDFLERSKRMKKTT